MNMPTPTTCWRRHSIPRRLRSLLPLMESLIHVTWVRLFAPPLLLAVTGEINLPLLFKPGDPLHVPMAGDVESLNASVAAGVVLAEFSRQRRLS